jgi:hypothetical protein
MTQVGYAARLIREYFCCMASGAIQSHAAAATKARMSSSCMTCGVGTIRVHGAFDALLWGGYWR